jgi:FkbM family methyltransferase
MNILYRKTLRKANSLKKHYFGDQQLRSSIRLLQLCNIKSLLDAGANTGQFAYYTRHAGYKHRIISFEPLSEAFYLLNAFARKDPEWETVNAALGDTDGEIEINISANLQSSSILEMKARHIEAAPESAFKCKEKVKIHKIDTIIHQYSDNLNETFLKIDTQGYGKRVLRGAEQSLKEIKGLQIELSLVELYQGETLYREMINFISDLGFTIFSIEPGFRDKETGQLLQVDVIFYRI